MCVCPLALNVIRDILRRARCFQDATYYVGFVHPNELRVLFNYLIATYMTHSIVRQVLQVTYRYSHVSREHVQGPLSVMR